MIKNAIFVIKTLFFLAVNVWKNVHLNFTQKIKFVTTVVWTVNNVMINNVLSVLISSIWKIISALLVAEIFFILKIRNVTIVQIIAKLVSLKKIANNAIKDLFILIITVYLNVRLHIMIINKFARNVHLTVKNVTRNNVLNVKMIIFCIMESVWINAQMLSMEKQVFVKSVNKTVKNVKMEINVKIVWLLSYYWMEIA